MPTTSSSRSTRPTVAQAYALVQQLTPRQQAALIARLKQSRQARVAVAAHSVQAAMEADGIFITEADIDAEVKAVRAERYAKAN